MKRILTATAITALTTTAAFAVDIEELDLNGDNFVSVEEAKMMFPDLQLESFNDIDMNDDRRLDANEVQSSDAQTTFDQYEMSSAVTSANNIVLDADGDGFIMMEDYQRAYPSFEMSSFEEIDLNDDNRVSYEEHYELDAQTELARYQTGMSINFADIDTDNDDFASSDEMMAAFRGLPMEVFEQIDDNSDNRISAQEWQMQDTQTAVAPYM